MKHLKSTDGRLTISIPQLYVQPGENEADPDDNSGRYVYTYSTSHPNPCYPGELEETLSFEEIYNQAERIANLPTPYPFRNGYELKLQQSYGERYTLEGNLLDKKSNKLGYGFFPSSLDMDTLTKVGLRMLAGGDVANTNIAYIDFSSLQNGSPIPESHITRTYLTYYVDVETGKTTYYIMVAPVGRVVTLYNYWYFSGKAGVNSIPSSPSNVDNGGTYNYVFVQSYMEELLGEGGNQPTPPPGGGSTEGGGDGDFDNTTTTIPLPDLPIISLANLGIVKQYQIGQSDITNLSNFLWDTGFETLFTKWMQDPTEALISLRMCPVPPITETDPTQVYIGSVEALGVNGNLLTERYIEVDMGTLTIPPYWGNFLDYNPHTKVEVYIPYSGFQKLDTDIVMNSTINLRYRIDYLSGEAVAIILVDKGEENLQAPIYDFPVNIFSEIPLTSKSSDLYRNALQLIGASAVAGIGAAAGGMTAGLALVNATASATNVVNSKETVQKVGGTGGSIGFMGVQTPYLIINRPEQSVPDDYNKFYGYPCNMWETLGNLEGYTVVERIHLENIIATSEELDLIEKELKSGVIL